MGIARWREIGKRGLAVAVTHHCLGAVLKPPHSRRYRDHQAFPWRAKRLDCGVFTAAF